MGDDLAGFDGRGERRRELLGLDLERPVGLVHARRGREGALSGDRLEPDGVDLAAAAGGDVDGHGAQRPLALPGDVLVQGDEDVSAAVGERSAGLVERAVLRGAPDRVDRRPLPLGPLAAVEPVPEDPDADDAGGAAQRDGSHLREQDEVTEDAEACTHG